MYKLTATRYIATALVDAASIVPNVRDITKLLEIINDKDILPTTFSPPSGDSSFRIGFIDPIKSWRFLLESDRFTIINEFANSSEINPDNWSDFLESAIDKMTKALDYYRRRSHGLATRKEGFIEGLDREKIRKISRQWLNFPTIYSQAPPFAWDWYSASLIEREFGECKEETNTITRIAGRSNPGVSKTQQNGSKSSEDKINLNLEINTSPWNSVARFNSKEIFSFFNNSIAWYEELESDILSFISEHRT